MTNTHGSNRLFAEHGLSKDDIAQRIEEYRSGDFSWDDLRNLKASYNAGPDVSDIAWDAYTTYRGDNLLYGKMMFPSLIRMADEVSGMALELLGASDKAAGTLTSGGTESIILAVKAAKEWAAAQRPTAGQPEIMLPSTAHAAFNKAAGMLGLTVKRIAVDETFRARPEAMAQAVTQNTIMIVGSAPAYPVGSVDPIPDLAAIAKAHRLWLHVDACVGGFFLPFAADLGLPITRFDFSVPGVRSMSVDLHKYGYASRGASMVLLAHRDDLEYQKFVFNDWPTGEFITTTVAGSRPGGAIAAAWAVVNHLGFSGYRTLVQKIVTAREELINKINALDDVRVLGRPEAGIVGIAAKGATDMTAIRAGMSARDWKFAPLVEPVGMNILLNAGHSDIIDDFVDDLKASIEDAKAGRTVTAAADSYGG